MLRTQERLGPRRRRAAPDRHPRGRLAHLGALNHRRRPLRRGRHLHLPPLPQGRGGGGPRGDCQRLAWRSLRNLAAGRRASVPWWSRAAGGSRGDDELHERRVLVEAVDVGLRRREPMCLVRGVVHGPAAGLTASKRGRRPGPEATLDGAATLWPSFLFLFTRVRGRGVL
jgi:hypothetical protein